MMANIINPRMTLSIKLYSLYLIVSNNKLLKSINDDQLIE